MRRFGRRGVVYPIQQMEAAECGIACVAMVLGYYGHHASLASVRDVCGTSRDGNSALDLLRGARLLGLTGRGVSVPLEGMAGLKLPAILHWDMNHFVVLERVERAAITIVDPASGRRKVAWSDVDKSFSGVALELAPGESFQKRSASSLSLKRYVVVLTKVRMPLLFVLLANLFAQVLALTFPAANQLLIDHVILPDRHEWLVPVLAAMALGAIGQVVLTKLQGASLALLHGLIGLELTTELGRRITELPLPFIDSRSHGDLLERVRVQSDLQTLLAAAAQGVFDVMTVALLSALMLGYDPRLGAVALGLIAVRVFVMRQFRAASEQRVAAELAARGREQGVLVEATRCPELIRGLGVEVNLVQRYVQRVTDRANVGIRAETLRKALASWLGWLGSAMEATILWYGGTRVIEGHMTLGVFSGFLAIRAMVEIPVGSLVGLFDTWIRFRGALQRSDDIVSVAAVPNGTQSADGVVGRIEAKGVGFRYGSGGRWIVRDVNFVIEPGEKVAFVGPSGQGKSTLGKMLVGLLEPTEGQVLLDGVPIGEYQRASLAAKLGVVLQEPLILEGTLHAALTVRIPDASLGSVWRAAELACFQEVVQRLPAAYESRVAALGSNLSGGERQRLALGQALLGCPRVLLLDEATCALDPDTEGRVLANLAQSRATILAVAHRGSVIERAARVFEVGAGTVREVESLPPVNASTRNSPSLAPSATAWVEGYS